jgi:hypothetical protein
MPHDAPQRAAQLTPQLPQLAGSLVVSTQVPPHDVKLPLQPHAPAVQVEWAPHVVAQLPQWLGSLWRSTQLVPQWVRPPAQLMSTPGVDDRSGGVA